MEIEEDLVEEVARVYGYNNIPDEPVQASLIMGTHREADLSLKRVKTLLNDKGYQEVITYSFVDPKVQQMIHPGVEALLLPSPISVEMSAMRLSLWTGLAGNRGVQPEPSAESCTHFRKRSAFRARYSGTVGYSSGSDVSRCDLR